MQNQLEPYQYELLADIPQMFERLAKKAEGYGNPRGAFAYNLCASYVRNSLGTILGMEFHTVQVEEADHEVQ